MSIIHFILISDPLSACSQPVFSPGENENFAIAITNCITHMHALGKYFQALSVAMSETGFNAQDLKDINICVSSGIYHGDDDK